MVMRRTARQPQRGGRGGSRRPTRRLPPVSLSTRKRSHKLSVDELDKVIECLSRRLPRPIVRERLRQEHGIDVNLDRLTAYQESHAEEIEKRFQRWLASLRDKPLTTPKERVVERLAQYRARLMAICRVKCERCLGAGVVLRKVKKDVVVSEICGICKGRKWVLPAYVREAAKTLGGDLRLETFLDQMPVEHLSLADLEQLGAILDAIGRELGDHWSPKDRGEAPEGGEEHKHLHLHGGAAVALAEAFRTLLAAPSGQVVELYKALAGKPALPVEGDRDNGGGQE